MASGFADAMPVVGGCSPGGGVGVAVTPQALLGLRVLGFRGLGVWRLVF